MYTTIKTSVSKLLVLLFIIIGCTTCNQDEVIPDVLSFKIYNTPIRALASTPNSYVILSDSVWFTLDSTGDPSKYYTISFDKKDKDEEYYTSDILYFNDYVYVLASVFSKQGEYIDLEIIKYTVSGEAIKSSRIRIVDGFNPERLKGNENSSYTIPFPLYAKGIVNSSSELVIAFNHTGKLQEQWGYALLHFDNELELINRKDYLTEGFYGWIYKISQLKNGKFVMTRGGNHWYAIDQFDLSLNVKTLIKRFPVNNGPAGPVLTNVIEVSDQKLIMTGHIDQQDNPTSTVSTNYDYWIVFYDLRNDLKEKIIKGPNNQEELCFTSYLTKDNKLILGGTRRGLNQVSLDLDSQVRIIETDVDGEMRNDLLITKQSGMEAFFMQESPLTASTTIIGRKFGFNEEDTHTFFKTVKYFKNE